MNIEDLKAKAMSDMSEIPSCFTQVNRKARKDHKCCECFETIQKGETYSYTSGVWDGTGQSFKQCTNCHEIIVIFPGGFTTRFFADLVALIS